MARRLIVPITPFHFGPGLLLKAAAPRHVSLTAFVTANILIDLESGYILLTGGWPVHRGLHTFAAATLVGVCAAFLIHWTRRSFRVPPLRHASKSGRTPAVIGGVLGGSSHALLDGIMHADMRPFRPFSGSNPLLLATTLETLHLFCLVTGVLGVLWLGVRSARAERVLPS